MIKAIIFDWGGVLIDDPAPGLVSYCASALGVAEDIYKEAFSEFGNSFQKGHIEEADLWPKVSEKLGVPTPKTKSLWGDAFVSVYKEKTEIFDLISRLKSNKYKVGFLSNTEVAAMQHFHRQNYDMFDVKVFSCAEGMTKPESNIYELALNKLGVKPKEAVFIDDREDYIAGAKEVGINTILFKTPSQIKKDLSKLKVKIS